jgi:hypothetical protein
MVNGIPPEIPNLLPKPVLFNSFSETTNLNVETVSAATHLLLVENGFEIKRTDSRMLSLIHDGATLAHFRAAVTLVANVDKPIAHPLPYLFGIVGNMLRQSAQQGPKTGSGSTIGMQSLSDILQSLKPH